MNINLDDPRLTAYALDELSGAEKAAMETAVATSPAAQEFGVRAVFADLGLSERVGSEVR